MRLEHFKCNYDPNWEYDKIAKTMFGDNKCMIQCEKMSSNPHVHFQGYTDLDKKDFDVLISELAATHYTKKDNPKGRPVKRARREIDESGFQYMCKEGHAPIYQQGFTDDELSLLKQQSDDHCDELKNGVFEHCYKRDYSDDPECAFDAVRLDALEYYIDNDRRPGPRFQKDCLWIMFKHPRRREAWKIFVARRI